jgi:hypothetical protein
MRASIGSSAISRLAGGVFGLCLCGAGAAWAGDGADLGSINTAWQTFCGTTLPSFGVSPPCPQIPTITQGILQLTAGQLVPPAVVRATNSTPLGQAVDAGNPSLPPATLATSPPTTAITAFPVKGTALSNLLPALTPLAFISSSKGPAAVTQLYNPNAGVFLYGVASGTTGQPDTLYLFYDDTSRTNGNLKQGDVVAEFSLPLVVLTGYPAAPIETTVPTTLQFRATNAGDCATSTVVGKFKAGPTTTAVQTLLAAQIGINCAVVFAPSPLSAKSHAIFEVAVPLIITMATDPLFFPNSYSVIAISFNSEETGFPPAPGFSSTNGTFPTGSYIGLPPSAAPLGPAPAAGAAYALCANLPGGNGNGQAPVPSVAAFYAIASDGETLLSAPLPGSSTSVCPF